MNLLDAHFWLGFVSRLLNAWLKTGKLRHGEQYWCRISDKEQFLDSVWVGRPDCSKFEKTGIEDGTLSTNRGGGVHLRQAEDLAVSTVCHHDVTGKARSIGKNGLVDLSFLFLSLPFYLGIHQRSTGRTWKPLDQTRGTGGGILLVLCCVSFTNDRRVVLQYYCKIWWQLQYFTVTWKN
jgi:hypothetical protein